MDNKRQQTKNQYLYCSYSEQDSDKVELILKKLADAGTGLWRYEGLMSPSQYSSKVKMKILQASGAIFFVSEHWFQDHRAANELTIALGNDIPSIVVFLKNIKASLVMEKAFSYLPKIISSDIGGIISQLLAHPLVRNTKGESFIKYAATPRRSTAQGQSFWDLYDLNERQYLNLDSGNVIIGSSQKHSGYVIRNPKISHKHLKLTYDANKWYAEDLQSTNHSYLNGSVMKAGEKYLLNEGDLLTIANAEFQVKQKRAERVYVEKEEGIGETGAASSACLKSWKDGNVYEISTSQVCIGRDPSVNDIVLSVKRISSQHAKIERRQDGYYLTDLQSSNGTELNQQRLNPHQAYRLRDGDQLRFAKETYTFLTGEK